MDAHTAKLLRLIRDEPFDYGFDTKADELVARYMRQDVPATMNWLVSIFREYHSTDWVLIGILRIIARLDYREVGELGVEMATSAVHGTDAEVIECGVRAFESWGQTAHIPLLQELDVQPGWVQEYIHGVIDDLINAGDVDDDGY